MRRRILNSEEISIFDSPPSLDASQRQYYFNKILDSKEYMEACKGMSSSNKANFLVVLVYFLMRRRFYYERSTKDLKYVSKVLGVKNIDTSYSRNLFSRHRKIILELAGIQPFKEFNIDRVESIIMHQLYEQSKRRDIFSIVFKYLISKTVEIPSSSKIEELIKKGELALDEKVERVFSSITSKSFRELADIFYGRKNSSDGRVKYKIHSFKKVKQSTRLHKLKENIEALEEIRGIFPETNNILRRIGLTQNGISHLAFHFRKSDHYQFKRMTLSRRYLYLCCFLNHQYKLLQDHMIVSFIDMLQGVETLSKNNQKDFLYELRAEKSSLSEKAFNKQLTLSKKIESLERVLFDRSIRDDTKISEAQKILRRLKTVNKSVSSKILDLQVLIIEQEENYTDEISKNAGRINKKIDRFISLLDFVFRRGNAKLSNAIKQYCIFGVKGLVNQSLPYEVEKYIVLKGGEVESPHLVKFYFFKYIADKIKAGEIGISNSFEYRLFEDYLISEESWAKNKNELMDANGMMHLKSPLKIIKSVSEKVEDGFDSFNKYLESSSEKYVRVSENGHLVVSTPGLNESPQNDLGSFFPEGAYITIADVLSTVNGVVNYLTPVNHHTDKFIKTDPSSDSFYGAIIGVGCHIGHKKICKSSKGLDPNEVDNIVNWYLSPDNLIKANDLIVNYLNKSALPQIYRNSGKRLFTSSDGQKWITSKDYLKSKRSYKYFGKDKGVVINTIVDERYLQIFSKVITATEREAVSMVEGVLHNKEIKNIDHSTDTHGYTENIFGIMNLLGEAFSPRIKSVGRQRRYSTRSVKEYSSFTIGPHKKINQGLIIQAWDDILRLLVSLKSGHVKAAVVLNRLNSYSDHKVYKGMREIGRLYKTEYILRYMQSINQRRRIDRQLNISENSNKFSKALAFGGNQELSGGSDEELDVIEGCKRLIKNSIICWNYLYFTQKLVELEPDKRKDLLLILKKSSMVRWKHVNFHGEYDFSKNRVDKLYRLDFRKINDLKIRKIIEENSIES
jgi:TnpA family transposase